MVIDLYELLSQNEILLTFVVIGIGHLLGRIKLGPIEIDPTTGVMTEIIGATWGDGRIEVVNPAGANFATNIVGIDIDAEWTQFLGKTSR